METFEKIFDRRATFCSEAPGRVNLIGEHTDYNGGFVLPMLIPQKTWINLSPRSDRKVRIATLDKDAHLRFCEYYCGEEEPQKSWSDYVQGLSWLLEKDGYAIAGFDALIESHVPMGAGLSSSASLLVALSRALRDAFQLPLNDVEIALLCQRVENEFVGAHVGIMDQMAVSLADFTHALFLDTRSLNFERIPLPLDQLEFFVINSGIRHHLAAGEGYNTRRAECEEACRQLGVEQLRDVVDDRSLGTLPERLQKRARHVLTENRRVEQAVQALKEGDIATLGRLMVQSHASMRDDYEVSVAGIDILVEEALQEPGVFGARLTGGGFGGSIIGLCAPEMGNRVTPGIVKRFQQRTNGTPTVLVPS